METTSETYAAIARAAKAFLVDYGFSDEQATKVVRGFGNDLMEGAGLVSALLENFKTFGFSKEQVIGLLSKSQSISVYQLSKINIQIHLLAQTGFQKDKIRKMMADSPGIIGLTHQNIQSKIDVLKHYGFSHSDSIAVFTKAPSALGLSEDTLNAKLSALESDTVFQRKSRGLLSVGLTKAEVKKAVLEFPAVLCFRENEIRRKKRLMLIISEGDRQDVIDAGRRWMQSVKKTAARSRFLKNKGYSCETKRVYLSAKQFKDNFGRSL
ncbi:hypothetical protein JXA56_01430 [Candidatus Micrarchaeota archaeon]|nr:hypothetical protein [Candidatus Micrarchaeota archaeon]